MRTPSHLWSVLGAAALLVVALSSCDSRPAPAASAVPQASATATPSAAAVPSADAPACAAETEPRRLLTKEDGWSTTDLDATSQAAFQLTRACDTGPEWPRGCDPFGTLLNDGWPGYRTEGAHYAAAINLLGVSGASLEEQLVLFETPRSTGLRLLTRRATDCKAVRTVGPKTASTYRFPDAGGRQRFLITDATVAIVLTVPDGLDAPKLIATALDRAMS